MPFSYKEFFNREGGMSLDTMLVTTVKGQVIIIGHWICALIWSLVHARWGRRIERERALGSAERRLLFLRLAVLLPPPLVLHVLLVLVLDQHERDVLSLQRHRLKCKDA